MKSKDFWHFHNNIVFPMREKLVNTKLVSRCGRWEIHRFVAALFTCPTTICPHVHINIKVLRFWKVPDPSPKMDYLGLILHFWFRHGMFFLCISDRVCILNILSLFECKDVCLISSLYFSVGPRQMEIYTVSANPNQVTATLLCRAKFTPPYHFRRVLYLPYTYRCSQIRAPHPA